MNVLFEVNGTLYAPSEISNFVSDVQTSTTPDGKKLIEMTATGAELPFKRMLHTTPAAVVDSSTMAQSTTYSVGNFFAPAAAAPSAGPSNAHADETLAAGAP
eukprot:GHVT01071631.1.p2 GENE.GHVT01071631.1~~GHVT01071631.1.p2  ORF type:complete len:102 (+),score=33.11 GHVT01071631.1:735-1040(+)